MSKIYLMPEELKSALYFVLGLEQDVAAIGSDNIEGVLFAIGTFGYLMENHSDLIEIGSIEIDDNKVDFVHPKLTLADLSRNIDAALKNNRTVKVPMFFGELSKNAENWIPGTKYHNRLISLYQGLPFLFFIPDADVDKKIYEISISHANAYRHMLESSHRYERLNIHLK